MSVLVTVASPVSEDTKDNTTSVMGREFNTTCNVSVLFASPTCVLLFVSVIVKPAAVGVVWFDSPEGVLFPATFCATTVNV